MNSTERDIWALKLEEELLVGGASFSEWATLMSFEAHTCFVAGADVSTIILCASACEAHLRTENEDFESSLWTLIENSGHDGTTIDGLHSLRKSRNEWTHMLKARSQKELRCYSDVYGRDLEEEAKAAYRTMLMLLFADQWL